MKKRRGQKRRKFIKSIPAFAGLFVFSINFDNRNSYTNDKLQEDLFYACKKKLKTTGKKHNFSILLPNYLFTDDEDVFDNDESLQECMTYLLTFARHLETYVSKSDAMYLKGSQHTVKVSTNYYYYNMQISLIEYQKDDSPIFLKNEFDFNDKIIFELADIQKDFGNRSVILSASGLKDPPKLIAKMPVKRFINGFFVEQINCLKAHGFRQVLPFYTKVPKFGLNNKIFSRYIDISADSWPDEFKNAGYSDEQINNIQNIYNQGKTLKETFSGLYRTYITEFYKLGKIITISRDDRLDCHDFVPDKLNNELHKLGF